VTGPEEDELPEWWRGPPVVETAPAPKPKPTRATWACTAAGCDAPIRPPWDRRPGVLGDDYCGPACVPTWVASGVPAPHDRWRRSGGRA
jgi:hypothetical protein